MRFLTCVTVFGLCMIGINASKNDMYKGFTVHGVKLSSNADLKVLNELSSELDLDEWKHGFVGQRDAEIMVAPEHEEHFLKKLDQNQILHYMLVDDVSKMLDQKDEELIEWRSKRTREATFDDYPRYSEILEFIEKLAEEFPDEVTLVNAGPSFEGRDIKYLKVSTSNFTEPSKPIVYMQAGIHSREWVTYPVPLYFLNRLLRERRTEDNDLRNDIDWIVMPAVNPDGYEYTHTTNRVWRRTRSYNRTNSILCTGVDGNRNFDYNFNQYGTSDWACSDVYAGPYPFSEVETQYVRDILFEHLERIELFFDIHSYGNYVLYGFDDVLAPNSVQLHHMGALMGAAMDAHKLPEADHYLVGNAAFILYGSAGNAQDYAQSLGIPFSYTLELPSMGLGGFEGFMVPPSYINHINYETWHGLVESARLARVYYRARFNN